MFDIDEELKKLPDKPGVYFMFDKDDNIIYIGKAKVLKNRVRQYFQNRSKGAKIDHMVTHIARFEYTITDSELEALILECNMIKEHRPKYNTMMMDDKTYPYIKVTVNETFPRVMVARKVGKDKAKYFGPYANGVSIKEIIDFIHKVFKIRSCNKRLPDERNHRPCLNYHIDRCDGPCQMLITPEDYAKNVEGVLKFLSGNTADLQKELREKMNEASERLEFEKAAEYLGLLNEIIAISQKQKITSCDGDERDIIGAAIEGEDAVVQIFFIRNGKLIGREHYYIHLGEEYGKDENIQMVLSNFISQFYSGTPYIPKQIMLQTDLKDSELLENWLSGKRGSKVTLFSPKIGRKEKLIELATENAVLILRRDKEKLSMEEKRTVGALRSFEICIGLFGIVRMEAYDISNINGFEVVGSMVVYENGKPKRSDYRKFKIKSFTGQDDVRSMREILTRRFQRGLMEKEKDDNFSSFTRFPDVILMDGGKGQVNAAVEVLKEQGLHIPVCGMVKDDHHRTRGIYYNNQEYSLDSDAFNLVTRIQDEAHRFAITYHRSLRSKGQVHSVLDEINGIGPERRKALMREFSSLDEIKEATEDDLVKIPGMSRQAAKNVVDFFRNK